jgi:Major Facilitator Superfamily
MLVLIGSGMACTAALIWRERLAPQPMLPLHLFSNPIFVAGTAVTSLMSAMLVGLIVVIPLNYQVVLGLSPGSTGLRMIPLTSGTAVGSLIAGQLVSRTGHYRLFVAIGAATAGLACVAIAETGLGFSPLFDVMMTGLLGLACGFQISPISVAVQNALRQEDTGVGMACLLLFRSLAGAIGVALFSALLIGVIGLDAFTGHIEEVLGHSALSPLSDPNSPLSAGSLTALGDAFRFAFSRIFFGGAITMAIAFCASLSLREIPLQKSTI